MRHLSAKWGFAALGAFFLVAGCATDEAPLPELRSPAVVTVSMFDTVNVRLSEEVNVPGDKNISIAPKGAKWKLSDDRQSVLVWGAATWPAGNKETTLSAFESNTLYTVEIEDLLSIEGRLQKGKIVVEIDVLPLVDSDFDDGEESNGNWGSADLLFSKEKFTANGKKWGTDQLFTGILAGDYVTSGSDLRDWYALDLTRDQLEFEVELQSNRAADLALHFYGPVPAKENPGKIESWPTDKAEDSKAKESQKLQIKIDKSRHYDGLLEDQEVGAAARYYLLVTYQKSQVSSPPIPYRLLFSTEKKSDK